jgi:hypothetical protein
LQWIKKFKYNKSIALNIRLETLKELQEAVGNTLEQTGIKNIFLNRTQKAQHLREARKKWDCNKLFFLHQTRDAHRMEEILCQLLI